MFLRTLISAADTSKSGYCARARNGARTRTKPTQLRPEGKNWLNLEPFSPEP